MSDREDVALPANHPAGGEIVLFEGRAGDPDTGEGWLPRVALEHLGAGRSEVGIIVGEEAEGMAEGISEETFEEIRKVVGS